MYKEEQTKNTEIKFIIMEDKFKNWDKIIKEFLNLILGK